MFEQTDDHPVVDLSLRVYWALLGAYPAAFRDDYSVEMMLVFRDRCREVIDGRGAPGVIGFWLLTLIDLIKTSIEEHTQQEDMGMSKKAITRGSGLFLLMSGVLLGMGALTLAWPRNGYLRWIAMQELGWTALGVFPVPAIIGLLGLYLVYRHKLDTVSQIGLLGALLGAVTAGTSVLLMLFVEEIWPLWWISGAVLTAGMAVFGVSVLRNKPLPRRNGLLALPGLGLVIIVILAILFPGDNLGGSLGREAGIVLYVFMGAMWVVPGLAMLALPDSREAAPA